MISPSMCGLSYIYVGRPWANPRGQSNLSLTADQNHARQLTFGSRATVNGPKVWVLTETPQARGNYVWLRLPGAIQRQSYRMYIAP